MVKNKTKQTKTPPCFPEQIGETTSVWDADKFLLKFICGPNLD